MVGVRGLHRVTRLVKPAGPGPGAGLGYYVVGRTPKTTGTVDGKTVVATRARWRYNPTVTVVWCDNPVVRGKNVLTSVSADNAAGEQVSTATVFSNRERARSTACPPRLLRRQVRKYVARTCSSDTPLRSSPMSTTRIRGATRASTAANAW